MITTYIKYRSNRLHRVTAVVMFIGMFMCQGGGTGKAFAQAGSLDTSFDSDGVVTTSIGSSNDYANSVAIQSDGKIVAVGQSFNGSNDDVAVLRYNSDGSLDTSFDTDGIVTTAVGSFYDYANSVAIQPDGKIVVAGINYNGSNDDVALLRYNSDGSLDTSFDTDGIVTTDMGGSSDIAYSVAIQSDGKVVVAGYSFNGSIYTIAVLRYNSDGSLDTSFDTDGIVTTAIGITYDYAYSVAIQSDGKIVVAGYSFNGSNYDVALLRYNSDGSLDTSFDTDGIVTTDIGSSDNDAKSVVIQSDGKIVVAGYSYNGSNNDLAVVRYNSDGSLDTSFDTDGIVTTDMGGSSDEAYSVAIQSDGKIVVVGYSYNGSSFVFAVVRYNSDGSLDTSFDTDGIVTTAIGSSYDFGFSVTIQSDGKIVVAGKSKNGSIYDFAVVRYIGKCNTSSFISTTTCDSYTVPSGSVTYTTSGTYSDTIPNAAGCDSIITINLTINASPSNQLLSASQNTLCPGGGSTIIDLGSSEVGVDYYLRDDANDMFVDGPVAGTGSGISLNTGNITSTTTYNVYAQSYILTTFNALEFTGNTGLKKVSLGTAIWDDNFVGQNQLTVEAWVKRSSTGSLHTIIGNYQGSYPFLFRIDNDKITFFMNSTASVQGSTTIPVGTWTHVAGTYDGTTIKVYINGVLDGSGSYSSTFNTTANELKIGGGLSTTEYFLGDIADVRLWNVVKTEAEIAAMKDELLMGSEPGLVANYQFTEGSGTTTSNSVTGNAYSGTLVNNPTWVVGPTLTGVTCDLEMSTLVTVTINQPTTGSQTFVECVGFSVTVGTNTYNTTGIYTDVLVGSNGCDSTVTTDLTIKQPTTGSQTLVECQGFSVTVGTNTYSTTGVYTDVLVGANGCDSTVTTDLTINTIDLVVTNTSPTLTANQTGATYQWLDCDNGNAIIPSETAQSFIATVNGNYAVEITLGSCVDTSACENITGVGINETANNVVSIYPNPTNGMVNINLGSNNSTVDYTISSIEGRLIKTGKTSTNNIVIDLSKEGNGVYFVRINTESTSTVYKLIKQ